LSIEFIYLKPADLTPTRQNQSWCQGTRVVFVKSVILPVKLNKFCYVSVITAFIIWRTTFRRRLEDLLTKVQNFKGWKATFVTSH